MESDEHLKFAECPKCKLQILINDGFDGYGGSIIGAATTNNRKCFRCGNILNARKCVIIIEENKFVMKDFIDRMSQLWVIEEDYYFIGDWVAFHGDVKLTTFKSEQEGLDEIDDIDKVYYSAFRVSPLTKETQLREGLSLTKEQQEYIDKLKDL